MTLYPFTTGQVDPDDQYWNKRIVAELSSTLFDPGHDLFRVTPAAVHVAYHPIILEAVTDLIGSTRRLDPCRHVHYNDSPEPGDWHIDDYCGNPWPKGEQFVIVCYFPQDTTVWMGPTAVRARGVEYIAAGPAGTFVAMRHHVEHRATANTSGLPRLMLKFLYRTHI